MKTAASVSAHAQRNMRSRPKLAVTKNGARISINFGTWPLTTPMVTVAASTSISAGVEYTRNTLERALGSFKASDVMGRVVTTRAPLGAISARFFLGVLFVLVYALGALRALAIATAAFVVFGLGGTQLVARAAQRFQRQRVTELGA